MNKNLHPARLSAVQQAGISVFTIGHSNHALEKFMGLLKRHEIRALADVRSQPYSRYSRHFIREALKAELQQSDMEYVFMGNPLGGRPEGCIVDGIRVKLLQEST